MYQNDPVKVLTGECRLSYEHLTQPYVSPKSPPGTEPKYSVTLLIPKTDAATKADIDQSIQTTIQTAIPEKWNGVCPPNVPVPIHDGDGVRESGEPFGEECKGNWVITASTKMKPQVVGIDNIACELSPSDIYSGMYARVTLRFFGYAAGGKKGIGCGLGNVLKTRDGEALSGNASAESDFAGIGAYPPANLGYPQTPQQTAYTQQPTPAYAPPGPPAPTQYQALPPQTNGVNPITGQPYV